MCRHTNCCPLNLGNNIRHLCKNRLLEGVKKIKLLLVDDEINFLQPIAERLTLKGFDVIVTSNLFGDILSDESAGLVGGLGLAPSANIGADYALFEPVHGSAPRLAGKNIANPMAAIMASKMMLNYLGENIWAERIENAIVSVLKEGKVLTPDLGGSSSTEQVTDAIINAL